MALSEAEELELLELEEQEYQDSQKPKGAQSDSALRGAAQGVTLGHEDELLGAVATPVKMAMDWAVGNKDTKGILDTYRALRDEERVKNDAAKAANPKTFMAGEFGGSALTTPFMPGATAAKMAALGALQGEGASRTDLTTGDPNEYLRAGVDTGTGAALGYVMPNVLKGGAKAAVWAGGKLKDAAGWAGKKAINSFLGPSEEAIAARFADPAKIKGAKAFDQLAEEFPADLNKLKNQVSADDAAAWKTLKQAIDPNQGGVAKTEVDQLFGQLKNDLNATGGGIVGKADKNALRVLEELSGDIQRVGNPKAPPTLLNAKGGEIPAPQTSGLSEANLKEIIQAVDRNTNWDDPSMESVNNALKSFRTKLDNILKTRNKGYSAAMEPVAEKTSLLDKLKRDFSIKEEPGKGYTPTNTTTSKMQLATSEKKPVTQELLTQLKALTGRDYLDESNTYRLAKEFEGGKINGSRSVNQMMGIFGPVGAGLGAMVGGPVGASVGAGAGATVGAATGSLIDKKGGQIAANLIDKTVAGKRWIGDKIPDLVKNNAPAFGKYARPLMQAMQQGAQQVGLTHWLLMNNDPEYRQMIREMEGEQDQQ